MTRGSLSAMKGLLLRIHLEDGFVAYLNGVEVLRMTAPDPLDWTSLATPGLRRTMSP
ncbi:MAG: hypothetical protein ABGZ49_04035 [Akkermansiaceae bacterium]